MDDLSQHPAFVAGHQAWPGVALPPERLLAFWQGRGVDPATIGAELAADGFIVCAVVEGVGGAAEALARRCDAALRSALRKASVSSEDIDDVLQRLWAGLLVDQGQGRKLGEWEARGQLLAFLRVSAVRLGLKVRRSQEKLVHDDERFEQQASALTPELAYLKESYRAAFRLAFQEALDSLSSREQLLLRQQVLDGLTVDALAALYRVHRATAARWVADARETLIQRTRRRFFAAVALPPGEGEGVMSLVESRLDETIRRRLMKAG